MSVVSPNTPYRSVLGAIAFPIVIAGCLVGLAGCGSQSASQANGGARMSPTPAYRVLSATSPSRPVYQVLVPPATNHEAMDAIVADIVARAKQNHPFAFLWVEFYDYPQLAKYAGPSLGWARFGSSGKVALTGNYGAMSLTSHYLTKDWRQRPDAGQVRVWAFWQALYWRPAHVGDLSRASLMHHTAAKFHLSVGQVNSAMHTVNAWVTAPIGRVW
jgi:hypothetical protein